MQRAAGDALQDAPSVDLIQDDAIWSSFPSEVIWGDSIAGELPNAEGEELQHDTDSFTHGMCSAALKMAAGGSC